MARSRHPGTSPAVRARYAAVIADVIGSRQLEPDARGRLQAELQEFLLVLNQGFSESLAAEFVITTGDEFQGLLQDRSIIPDLIWAATTQVKLAGVRFGVGYGEIHTPLLPQAVGMDGPAFHAAREAITVAKKEGWGGGVFRGFGDNHDRILDGIAHLLERQTRKMTPNQRDLAELLRNGLEQNEAANYLGISRQAVSKQLRSLGWKAFAAGEEAFRVALAYVSETSGTP